MAIRPNPKKLVTNTNTGIGKIHIGVKWINLPNAVNIYVGRGSPLGNPYPITDHQSRDCVCDKYDTYLIAAVEDRHKRIVDALNEIAHVVLNGRDVNLQCYCQGKRCHAQSIKKIIEGKINE